MGRVVRWWNNWEVQILVLVSFALQVFLLMFAGMRRRNISIVPRTLLWLAYLMADSVALYILGHMLFSSMSHEKQQLMAFWAPFLLVHLGGQDTITAYSIEDNQLWPRHLLTFAVQALGVAYVLYKYIAGSWTLVTAAALIFVTGVLKYGERIWALKSSSLDNMSKFLDGRKLREAERASQPYRPSARELGPEEVLQGAHDLLPICMAQFVDYKFWPSSLQSEAIELFYGKGCMYELIEMQLSLVHDFLYTKAAVVFTWYGCSIRAISSLATITAFFLFQSSIGKNDFDRGDTIVTYILIVGAVLLEMIALLKAMGSTWTCALLRAEGWDWLHSIVIHIRRFVKTAETDRRWSGVIGQPRTLHGNQRGSRGCIKEISKWVGLDYSGGCKDLLKKLHRSLPIISHGTKELVLGEVHRLVLECDGKEDIMRSYSGQCVLKRKPWHRSFKDPTSRAGIDFDEKILAWYFATKMFLSLSSGVEATHQEDVVEAIKAVSNYMVFLLVERPYMLPSPIRPGSYVNSEAAYAGLSDMKYLTEYTRRKGECDKRGYDEGHFLLEQTLQKIDRIRAELEEMHKRREGLDPNNMENIRDAIAMEIIGQEMDRIWAKLKERDKEQSSSCGNGAKLENLNEYLPPHLGELEERAERNIDQADRKWKALERLRAELRVGPSPPPALARGAQLVGHLLHIKVAIKLKELERIKAELRKGPSPPPSLARGAQLVEHLLYMEGCGEREVRRLVLGVWVEMLCYAAHQCSRDSHARQLNNGGEFITIVWLLSTAVFNHRYCGKDWFKEGVQEFFRSQISYVDLTRVPFYRRLLICCGISHQRERERSVAV